MSKKTKRDRIEHWTRRHDKAIPYGFFARLSDRWCARKDARAPLPEVLLKGGDVDSAPGERTWSTPRTAFLGQLGRGWTEKSLLRYQDEVGPVRIELTQARARQKIARDRLELAQHTVENLSMPTQQQLEARVSGEERTSDEIRIARRMREHGERRKSLEAEVSKHRTALDSIDTEIAKLEETIKVKFEYVRTQAEIVEAYVRRRSAVYLAHLVRMHPQGEQIGLLVRPDWEDKPRWCAWTTPRELEQAVASHESPVAEGERR
ncbi:hypothetical protein [Lentzea fradiae]|nr:hypothetical protein [Lentzea fradiae]